MRAAVVTGPGAGPVAAEFAEPEAGPGREIMEVVAAGVHPVVRSIAAGSHYGSGDEYPVVAGVDCVARSADGVLRYAGSVARPWGTIAERVPVLGGIPLPDGADPVAIAGGLNPGMSSWLPLSARRIEIGELGTVLVLGATGVAGRMAVQIAQTLGAARVVAVGRDPRRLVDLAALGADPVDLRDGVPGIADALGGRAPTTIIDFVWGAAAETAWQALARHGLDEDTADIEHIEIGAAAGAAAALPAALLRSRRLRVRGSGAGSTPVEQIMRELPVLMRRIAAGRISVPVATYSLEDIGPAWEHRPGERAVVTFGRPSADGDHRGAGTGPIGPPAGSPPRAPQRSRR
jgi:NADPH:quinone reductase-like Zn-dependent oxidoreductase